MIAEKTIIRMVGLSYRPYRLQLVKFMQSHGYSTRPYFQIYLWLWVITFRPPWRHYGESEVRLLWCKYLRRK